MYLAVLFVFVRIAVLSAADEHLRYVSRDFVMASADEDPNFSSVMAAKNGFRVFTNPPGHGITETLTVTHSDGLYVAGEKVVTESEHRRVVRELQETRTVLNNILTRLQENESEVLALVQALREVSPANSSLILQPPICEDPGGDKLHYNGTHWECVCNAGYSGESCSNNLSSHFLQVQMGSTYKTSTFEGGLVNTRYSIHTRLPKTCTTNNKINVTVSCVSTPAANTTISIQLNENLLDYLQNGVQHSWVAITCDIVEGSFQGEAACKSFFTGDGGNNGWIISDNTGGNAPSTTFASSYAENDRWDFCNAVSESGGLANFYHDC